jgi:putative phage-type endonuclease
MNAQSTTTHATRESWLIQRKNGIGGSDAAAAIGASPWKSPFALWSEKVGLVESPDLSDNEAVEWGNRLEPVIAQAYAERSGRHVTVEPPFTIRTHPEYPWMLATLDATQGDDKRGPGNVQIKTAGASHVHDWDEEPPLHYQVQVQHEMAVSGLRWTTLVVLIGGQKLRWFDIARNERFIVAMIAKEQAFWQKVTDEEPPEVDGSEQTAKVLGKLFPEDDGEAEVLPQESLDWDRELVEVKVELAKLEERKRLAENHLRLAIGAASMGILPDGTVYTNKQQTRAAHSVAESTFRVLRRKGGK